MDALSCGAQNSYDITELTNRLPRLTDFDVGHLTEVALFNLRILILNSEF